MFRNLMIFFAFHANDILDKVTQIVYFILMPFYYLHSILS